MVAGESQDWSWAASGCVRSLFFVLASYRSTAALKIDWKLDEEEVEGVFGTWDIELIAKQISRQEEDDRKVVSANTVTTAGGVGHHRVPVAAGRLWIHLFVLPGHFQFRHHHHIRNLGSSHTIKDKKNPQSSD